MPGAYKDSSNYPVKYLPKPFLTSSYLTMGKAKKSQHWTNCQSKQDSRSSNSPDACNAAIHGKQIQVALGYELTWLSVIRGIRHHYGFALDLRGVTPEFTPALNAWDIMSGIIPTMSNLDETPYYTFGIQMLRRGYPMCSGTTLSANSISCCSCLSGRWIY